MSRFMKVLALISFAVVLSITITGCTNTEMESSRFKVVKEILKDYDETYSICRDTETDVLYLFWRDGDRFSKYTVAGMTIMLEADGRPRLYHDDSLEDLDFVQLDHTTPKIQRSEIRIYDVETKVVYLQWRDGDQLSQYAGGGITVLLQPDGSPVLYHEQP